MNFYYTKFLRSKSTERWHTELYPSLSDRAKLWLDVSKHMQNDLIARKGMWVSPWPIKIHDQCQMPDYDPDFSPTFEQVMDARAEEVYQQMVEKDEKFVVTWSGGIDSTGIVVALLKNIPRIELIDNVAIMTNQEGILENPIFFKKHLEGFQLIDGGKITLDAITGDINGGSKQRPIIGDSGDSIFGTLVAIEFLSKFEIELKKIGDPFTRPYQEFEGLIVSHIASGDLAVGKYLYDQIDQNIQSVDVPVVSPIDFFWWFIFNIREVECCMREGILNNWDSNKRRVIENQFNWYCSDAFQKWSMVNNQTGQKMSGPSPTQYKQAARDYIYKYDGNASYFYLKPKYTSFSRVLERSQVPNANRFFALDEDYNALTYNDCADFITQNLRNF